MGVMHSVDKWLDGDELNQDEVNRAATMREKTLQIVEGYQVHTRVTIDFYEKREKEIFERIERMSSIYGGAFHFSIKRFDELKKKYTGGDST